MLVNSCRFRSLLLLSAAAFVSISLPATAQEVPLNSLSPAPAQGPAASVLKDARTLSIREIKRLSPQELQHYTNFTPEQLAALNPEQLKALNKEQVASVEMDELQGMAPEQLAAIEPAVGPLAGGLFGAPALLGVGGAAAAGVGVAAAAGGGGGDSDGGGSTSTPAAAPAPAPTNPAPPGGNPGAPPAPPPAPAIAEEDRQVGWRFVGADYAQAQGITGAGVNVAILDTLIDPDSIELGATQLDCFDASTSTVGCVASPTIPENGHGTFISGILAADDNDIFMVGIAPEANLLNAGIFTEDDTGFDIRLIGVTDDQRADALNWAVTNGAQVSNHSYGFSGAYNEADRAARVAIYADGTNIHAAIDNAVANDVVLVWATGNEGLAQPSTQAALPLDFPEWENHWLAVTAVDTQDGAIASYANKCGDAAAFCLAAPGGDPDGDGGLTSYTSQNFIATASGTSFAAPHVTGAIALAIEQFGPGTASNLSNDRIADLILGTANSAGIYSDQSIYGQGLLDIEAALRYDPATGVFATGQNFTVGTQSVSSTGINFGPAFGDGAINALNNIQAGASDQFGRIAFVELSSLGGHASTSLDSKKLLTDFARHEFTTHKMGDLGEMHVAFKSDPLSSVSNNSQALESLSFISQIDDVSTLRLDYKRNPALQMGFQSEGRLQDTILMSANEQSLIPYFDFAGEDAMSAGLQTQLSENSNLKFLGFTTTEEEFDVLLDKGSEEQDHVSGFALEASRYLRDDLQVGLMVGLMQEENFVLGTEGAGAFDIEDNTPTSFAGMNIGYDFNEGMRFIASAQMGWTNANAVSDSFYEDFSTIRTDSYTAGFLADAPWQTNDQFGFVVHQPLRVSSASAQLSYPVARANDSSVISQSERINLEPDGREINFQAFYQTTFENDGQFNAALMLRREPGHIKDAEPDGVAVLRYKMNF